MESDLKKLISQSAEKWNEWRAKNSKTRADLRDLDFETGLRPRRSLYDLPEFDGYNFSKCDLHGTNARNCVFINCSFDDSEMSYADLCFALFINCSFKNISMRVTRIGSAQFKNCSFKGTDLGYCSAEE